MYPALPKVTTVVQPGVITEINRVCNKSEMGTTFPMDYGILIDKARVTIKGEHCASNVYGHCLWRKVENLYAGTPYSNNGKTLKVYIYTSIKDDSYLGVRCQLNNTPVVLYGPTGP